MLRQHPDRIDLSVLNQFEEFAEFRKPATSDSASQEGEQLDTDSATAEERIDVGYREARYGEYTVSVSIQTLETTAGYLPARALRLVQQWAALHREELLANWERAQRQEAVEAIEPHP